MKNKTTPSIFVVTVEMTIAPKLKADLTNQNFEFSKPPYTVFAAKKKGLSCVLYESGKLTVQGKDTAEFVEFYLEPEILKTFSFTYKELDIDKTPRIGVDETGKGDFFGPLCIAAVYAGGEDVLKLHSIGVVDSKKLSDPKAIEIGKKIQSRFAYHIVKINPAKYNEMYAKFKNLNKLLAWGHATCIRKLIELTKCSNVIIDQFGHESLVINALGVEFKNIELTQRHKGEEDLVVAAASILARKTFLEGMAQLSREIGMTLPKGASSQVKAAGKNIFQKDGPEGLYKVSKVHFKTYAEVTGQNLDFTKESNSNEQ